MNSRPISPIQDQRGLTLLEMLIALTILGLIFVILGSALRISYNSIRTGDKKIEQIHRARVVTEQIAQELRSAYRLSTLRPTEDVTFFRGEPDRIRLVSTTPLRTRGLIKSGLKEVTFSLGEDEDTGRRGLMMREDVIPHGELFEEGKGTEVILDPTVVELHCRYYGSAEAEGETPRPARWGETWEGDSLPEAVEVRLTFQEPEKGGRLELPPITLSLPIEQAMELEK